MEDCFNTRSSKDVERQCVLERMSPMGVYRLVSWIPAAQAVVGRSVALIEVRRDNKTARGYTYTVMSVHGERIGGKLVRR